MVFMRLHIANDGYGGINIQVEIKFKKKKTGASVAQTPSPLFSRSPWIH